MQKVELRNSRFNFLAYIGSVLEGKDRKRKVNFTIDIKRIILSTISCFIVAVLSCYLSKLLDNPIIIPIAFALTIPLTNIDKVRIDKLKAFFLSIALTVSAYFFAILTAFGLSWVIGISALYISCAIAGATLFLINSIYTKVGSFKVGLIITTILAIPTPTISQLLNLYIFNIEPSSGLIANPDSFFIIWQTLFGFGLSIGIWLNSKENTKLNNAFTNFE